jgi:hypothetical protein
MIKEVILSPLHNKRFRVVMNDGKTYDFGYKDSGRLGSTYIDHNSGRLRNAYRARHLANPAERRLIENLVPSPALFAYYLLWGNHRTLSENKKELNEMLKKKYQK